MSSFTEMSTTPYQEITKPMEEVTLGDKILEVLQHGHPPGSDTSRVGEYEVSSSWIQDKLPDENRSSIGAWLSNKANRPYDGEDTYKGRVWHLERPHLPAKERHTYIWCSYYFLSTGGMLGLIAQPMAKKRAQKQKKPKASKPKTPQVADLPDLDTMLNAPGEIVPVEPLFTMAVFEDHVRISHADAEMILGALKEAP